MIGLRQPALAALCIVHFDPYLPNQEHAVAKAFTPLAHGCVRMIPVKALAPAYSGHEHVHDIAARSFQNSVSFATMRC